MYASKLWRQGKQLRGFEGEVGGWGGLERPTKVSLIYCLVVIIILSSSSSSSSRSRISIIIRIILFLWFILLW